MAKPAPSDADLTTTRDVSQQKRGVSAALYRISTLVGGVENAENAMAEILGEFAVMFDCDACMVALVDPDTNALRVEHASGFREEMQSTVIPPGVGLPGWVALHRTPLLIEDALEDPRHVLTRAGTRSAIILPLEIDDHLHGVFSLLRDTPGAFRESDLNDALTLVTEAARVLRQMWRFEHLTRKARQFEVLSGISQELSSKLETAELLQTLTRDAVRLTGCSVATIQLHDSAGNTLQIHAAHPEDAISDSIAIPLQECLSGSAVTTRKQIEFSNLQEPEYEDLRDIPAHCGVEAVLSTPLLSQEGVHGMLNIFTAEPHRFSNDERRLLRALANLASVALQNARLYQRVFETEETLRQNERLTTLGLLAAEIAHETRNPLTVIRLLFGALGLEFGENDPRHTDVGIIREKLDQLEGFVGRVLSFAKAPESMHARVSLDEIIRETCVLLRLKLTQAHIHLHYDPPSDPVIVDCNKGQIQQVLLNLLLNSIHAMPEGGAVTIVTARAREGSHDTVRIDISDTGSGIPESFREKIFESFLSGRSEGTGLGLAIAKRIMRSHHGELEIAATSSEGTTMRLILPTVR